MNIQNTIDAFIKAKTNYENAFDEMFNSLKPLDNKRFWQLMDVFSTLVFDDASNPIDEFFRKPQAASFSFFRVEKLCPTYTFEEAMRFVINWRNLKKALYHPLFNVIQDRGDDGYSDLLDALPLAGESIINNCLNKQYDYNEFCASVEEIHHKAYTVILYGENYFTMHLKEEAQNRFLNQ